MLNVLFELEIQKSQHVYVDYAELKLMSISCRDQTITLLAELHQRNWTLATFERTASPSSAAYAGKKPLRQPQGPPHLEELIAKPTSNFEGSKNFVARQRRPFGAELDNQFIEAKQIISAAQVTSTSKPKLATTQARKKKERSHEDLDDKTSFEENAPPLYTRYADIVSPEGSKHSGESDCVLRKRFVCVDISHDKDVLSSCEDCTKGKKYYSFYKAALHLRQDHIKNQARDFKHGQLATEVLNQWIAEIEELVPEHLAPYDDFNYLEDNAQIQKSGLESNSIPPNLETELQSEKMIVPTSASRINIDTREAPPNMTDGARDQAVPPAITWEAGADLSLKTQDSLSGRSRSDERDTKPITYSPVGESIEADNMASYSSGTEAIPPDVTRRRIPKLWSVISSYVLCLINLLYLDEYLHDLSSSALKPYWTLVQTVGLYILYIVLVAFDLGLLALVSSLEISVPRNDQITKWEWECGIFHFKLVFHTLRRRIYGENMPMMVRCRIESCPPDLTTHSAPNNTFTKLGTMYRRAALAICALVRIICVRLTRGRLSNTKKKRIHSQCRCGHRFFDDYFELEDGAASRYSGLLQRRSPVASLDWSSGRQVSSKGSSENSGTSNLISSAMYLIDRLGTFGNYVLGRDSVESSLPKYRLETTNNERPRSQGRNDELLFLLLCVPHRQYATKLLQPQISAIRSDKDFFQLLRTNYEQMRGRVKRALSLKTLRSIKFVQLEMYKSKLVDIRKQDDMPPEAKKDEYRYNPIPAELIPPIGENHMLHLINHPSHAEEDGLLLDRIPKKLKERLLVCPSRGTGLGWGIYFIEGWHTSVITLVAFAVVLAGSLAFLVCWSVLKHDVQGASGVAAYMMAFLGLAIGSIQAVFELT